MATPSSSLCLRAALKHKELEVVAINDLVGPDNLAYLFQYDSTHGTFEGSVEANENSLHINKKKILVFAEKDPLKLPWRDLKIDYVVESTRHFTKREGASLHLKSGAKRVLISAPAKENTIPTFVMGVNEDTYNPHTHTVIS